MRCVLCPNKVTGVRTKYCLDCRLVSPGSHRLAKTVEETEKLIASLEREVRVAERKIEILRDVQRRIKEQRV